jgi:hypothetical protein
MAKVGRPTKYEGEATLEKTRKFVEAGFTLEQLAVGLDVDETTIHEWQNVHPEFSQLIKETKAFCDEVIERSLFNRAKGMKRKTVITESDGTIVEKIEDVPPDATSMIFWLKNRKRIEWKDRQDIEHSGAVDIAPQIILKVPEKK